MSATAPRAAARARHDPRRYQRLATDWFDYLLLSPAELADIAGPAGWRVTEPLPGLSYAAVLERASTAR